MIEQNVNRNSILGNTIQFIYDYSQDQTTVQIFGPYFGLNFHVRQFKRKAQSCNAVYYALQVGFHLLSDGRNRDQSLV